MYLCTHKTVVIHLQQQIIGIWCNGNTTDSGPVILGSSPSIPTVKRGCVKTMHPLFLRTKPRLSQAGALLLPKDFVSLSISSLL